MHSSQTVIESLDFIIPPNPVETQDSDLQPYVQIYIRARPRRTEGESVANIQEDVARFSPMAYRTLFSLRNVQPSAYKN